MLIWCPNNFFRPNLSKCSMISTTGTKSPPNRHVLYSRRGIGIPTTTVWSGCWSQNLKTHLQDNPNPSEQVASKLASTLLVSGWSNFRFLPMGTLDACHHRVVAGWSRPKRAISSESETQPPVPVQQVLHLRILTVIVQLGHCISLLFNSAAIWGKLFLFHFWSKTHCPWLRPNDLNASAQYGFSFGSPIKCLQLKHGLRKTSP